MNDLGFVGDLDNVFYVFLCEIIKVNYLAIVLIYIVTFNLVYFTD